MTSSPYAFLTDVQFDLLLANGLMSRAFQERDALFDPHPAVKLFTPDAGATWLLTEVAPEEPSIAFGLCDLGLAFPELGCVSQDELATVRGRLCLPIEQDTGFRANGPLSAYAAAARSAGRIQA